MCWKLYVVVNWFGSGFVMFGFNSVVILNGLVIDLFGLVMV